MQHLKLWNNQCVKSSALSITSYIIFQCWSIRKKVGVSAGFYLWRACAWGAVLLLAGNLLLFNCLPNS